MMNIDQDLLWLSHTHVGRMLLLTYVLARINNDANNTDISDIRVCVTSSTKANTGDKVAQNQNRNKD